MARANVRTSLYLFTLNAVFLFTCQSLAADIELFLPRPAPPPWWGRSGENWFALFTKGQIKAPIFEVKKVQSKIYVDSRDGVLKLGAQNNPDPLVFISGLTLKPGVVATASGLKFGAPLTMNETTPVEFEYKKIKWSVSRKTIAKVAATSEWTEDSVKYMLRSKDREFEIGSQNCRLNARLSSATCEEKWTPHFVGDLDRDGIPDLLYVQGDEKAELRDTRLWLSSLKKTIAVADLKDLENSAEPFRAIVRNPKEKEDANRAKRPGLLIPHAYTSVQKLTSSFDIWMGLFGVGANLKLEPVQIWVACAAATCEEKNFIGVSTPSLPRFLFRGIPGLKAGEISVADFNELPRDPENDAVFDSFEIEFAKKKLKLVGGAGFFTLDTSEKKTPLPLKTVDPDDRPKLIWAGDLNHDDLVDLLFVTPGDGTQLFVLFVSPEGATGPITEPTAKACTGACY